VVLRQLYSTSSVSPEVTVSMFIISGYLLPYIIYHKAAAFLRQSPHLQKKWNIRNIIPLVRRYESADATTFQVSGTITNGSYVQDGWYKSHICTINCLNLGGIVQAKDSQTHGGTKSNDDSTISVSLGSAPNFVVLTGESGSGKSLLVSTSLNLILGEKKVAASLLSDASNYSKVEVIMKLSEPHLSIALKKFQQFQLDTVLLPVNDIDHMATLSLARDFSTAERSRQGVKSTCTVNGSIVPLRTLRSIASAFIAVVDGSAASVALSSQGKRMTIIDVGVSYQYPELIPNVIRTRNKYLEDRRQRELIQNELELRVLPKALMTTDSSEDESKLSLLEHFIDELDSFEARIHSFQEKCKNSPYSDMYLISQDRSQAGETISNESLKSAYSAFVTSSWFDFSQEAQPLSLLYTNLLGMRNVLIKLDAQIASAQSACDVVTSLSSKNSMFTALECARSSLYNAGEQGTSDDIVSKSFERSHELLNDLEDVLQKCRRFFDHDTWGPVASLKALKHSLCISVDEIDLLISDWSVLSRKHGVSPYLLPSCHRSLRQELDGNVESSILLPKALMAEECSLNNFAEASRQLSNARRSICNNLSQSVSQLLPSLGMEAIFISRLNQGIRKCTDVNTGSIGLDSVDFLLVHKNMLKNGDSSSVLKTVDHRCQLLDVVGSSGEKARILLCIETILPGSIGACIIDPIPNYSETIQDRKIQDSVHPLVAVLYDEIDAHVGGRALLSMGKMLLKQTRGSFSSTGCTKKRGQVITITHSPSLAALADLHVVVRKVKLDTCKLRNVTEVSVICVEGDDRTKELARMASGDIAVDEAEIFAKALMRDRRKFEED